MALRRPQAMATPSHRRSPGPLVRPRARASRGTRCAVQPGKRCTPRSASGREPPLNPLGQRPSLGIFEELPAGQLDRVASLGLRDALAHAPVILGGGRVSGRRRRRSTRQSDLPSLGRTRRHGIEGSTPTVLRPPMSRGRDSSPSKNGPLGRYESRRALGGGLVGRPREVLRDLHYRNPRIATPRPSARLKQPSTRGATNVRRHCSRCCDAPPLRPSRTAELGGGGHHAAVCSRGMTQWRACR